MKPMNKQDERVIHYLETTSDTPVTPVDQIMRRIRATKKPKRQPVTFGKLIPVLSFMLVLAIAGWIIGPEPFWRLGAFIFDKESRIVASETSGTIATGTNTIGTDTTNPDTTTVTTTSPTPVDVTTWRPIHNILDGNFDTATFLHEILLASSEVRILASDKQQNLLITGEALLLTSGNSDDFMIDLFSLFPNNQASGFSHRYETSLSPDGKILVVTQLVDSSSTGLTSQTVLFDVRNKQCLSLPEEQRSKVVTAWSEDGKWFLLFGSPDEGSSKSIWRWKRDTDTFDRLIAMEHAIEALYADNTGLASAWGNGILSIQQGEFPEEAWVAVDCPEKPLFVDASALSFHSIQNGVLFKTTLGDQQSMDAVDSALPTGITDWRVQGLQAAFMTENQNLFVWNRQTGKWKSFEPNAKDPNYLLPDMVIAPDGESILYNGQGEWVLNDGTKDIMYRQENPPGYSPDSAVFTDNGEIVISQMPQRKGVMPGNEIKLYLLTPSGEMQALISFAQVNDGVVYPEQIGWMYPTPVRLDLAWDSMVSFGLNFDAAPETLNSNTIRIRDVVHDRDITDWYDITWFPDARMLQLKRNETAGSLREIFEDYAMSRLDGIEIQFVGPFTDWEGNAVSLDFQVTLSLLPAPMPEE